MELKFIYSQYGMQEIAIVISPTPERLNIVATAPQRQRVTGKAEKERELLCKTMTSVFKAANSKKWDLGTVLLRVH